MRLPPPYDRLLIPIYLPTALISVSNQAMLLLLPLYALHISGSPAYAALVMGCRGLGILLLDVPAGVLVGRFGDKLVLLGGVIANTLSVAAFALATDQWLVALLAIPYGGGTTAWVLSRQSYITDTCAPDERGRAIAVMAGIHRVGALVGPLAGGLVANFFGYPIAFLAGAGVSAAVIFIVLGFTRNVRPDSPGEWTSLASIGRIVVTNREIFTTAGYAALTIQLMRAARQLLVPLFGTLVGLDAATIGVVYSLSAALDMSLFYPVGVIMDRWGRKWTGVPSTLLFVLGLTVLPLSQGFHSLLAGALILGFANGLSTGIVMIVGMDLAPAGQRGEFLGVWRLIGDVGGVGAPLLTGVLVDIVSLGAASFVVAGLGLAGAVVFLLWVPETLRYDGDTRGS